MPGNLDVDRIVGGINQQYLADILVRLAKVPTEIPLGPDTFIEPDDPKLVHYVQQVLRPELQSLGVQNIADVPRNQLVVTYGSGVSDASLLVMVYTPTQHHNLMNDPFSGKVANATEWGFDEPCVFGQGVGQNKSHQAIMMAVLKALVEQNVVCVAVAICHWLSAWPLPLLPKSMLMQVRCSYHPTRCRWTCIFVAVVLTSN